MYTLLDGEEPVQNADKKLHTLSSPNKFYESVTTTLKKPIKLAYLEGFHNLEDTLIGNCIIIPIM